MAADSIRSRTSYDALVHVRDYLARDHARLDALLTIETFEEFRAGLLRHIGIEEKILFPLIGRDSPLVQQLHRDHAALGVLVVPPPTAQEIAQIRAILDEHNPLEENPGGLYDLVGDDVMERVRAFPEVPLAPHADSPIVRRSIEQLLHARRR